MKVSTGGNIPLLYVGDPTISVSYLKASLNAPEMVVQHEERMLLASLIIHAFAKEIKKIS